MLKSVGAQTEGVQQGLISPDRTVPFMVVRGSAVLNLLVGLLVNAMQAAAAERQDAGFEAEVLRRLRAVEERLPRS